MRYELAEKEFYTKIVSETGSQDKKNGFLGRLPDITNAWCFESFGPPSGWQYPCAKMIIINYNIKGRFSERQSALNFKKLLIDSFDNEEYVDLVSLKRSFVEQVSEPELKWIRLYGSKKRTAHWELNVPFLIQYNLSEEGGIGFMGIEIDFIVS